MAEEELVDMTFFVDLVSELREKLGKMPTAKQLVDNCQALTVAEAKEVLAAMPKLPPLAKKQKRTPVEPTQSPEVPAEPAAAAAPSEKAANGGQDRFTNALVPQAEGQGLFRWRTARRPVSRLPSGEAMVSQGLLHTCLTPSLMRLLGMASAVLLSWLLPSA